MAGLPPATERRRAHRCCLDVNACPPTRRRTGRGTRLVRAAARPRRQPGRQRRGRRPRASRSRACEPRGRRLAPHRPRPQLRAVDPSAPSDQPSITEEVVPWPPTGLASSPTPHPAPPRHHHRSPRDPREPPTRRHLVLPPPTRRRPSRPLPAVEARIDTWGGLGLARLSRSTADGPRRRRRRDRRQPPRAAHRR